MIILDTIKGQGVKYIEDFPSNHHIRASKKVLDNLELALNDLKRGMSMEIIKEQIELRKVLVNKMEELMDKDEKVVLVDADLMGSLGSYSLEEKYKRKSY